MPVGSNLDPSTKTFTAQQQAIIVAPNQERCLKLHIVISKKYEGEKNTTTTMGTSKQIKDKRPSIHYFN